MASGYSIQIRRGQRGAGVLEMLEEIMDMGCGRKLGQVQGASLEMWCMQ